MPKIGDALKKAVELKPQETQEDRSRSKPSSALMNANRRRIFQHLCSNPCSDLGGIVSALEISRSSVKWHLECLVEAEYVTVFRDGSVRAYSPAGMISQANAYAFYLLARKDCAGIFAEVLGSPGTDVGSLSHNTGRSLVKARGCLKRLREAGLVSRVMDGRHARYFPTDRLPEMLREEKRGYKEFTRMLVARLTSEHLKPRVSELKGVGVAVEITMLGRAERIHIPYLNL